MTEMYVELLDKIRPKRIVLTDEEWMSIIVRDRDGLPACCANISSLRDVLISIARNDGNIGYIHADRLAETLTWCFPDHDVPSPEMNKILDQLEWKPEFVEHMKGSEL